MLRKNIFLMGIKHCGKSTQARLLSKFYSCPAFDTDDLIFEMTGKSPREIYNEFGKDSFLEAETNACIFLQKKLEGRFSVIATGGGICNNSNAIEIIKNNGILIFLDSEEEIAIQRILKEIEINQDGTLENVPAYIAKEQPKNLDDVRKIFHDFYVNRTELYNSICDVKISIGNASKAENTKKLIDAIECLF